MRSDQKAGFLGLMFLLVPIGLYTDDRSVRSMFIGPVDRDWDLYKDKLLLRSQQVANSPEIIRRLGVIAMNTPLEGEQFVSSSSYLCSTLR